MKERRRRSGFVCCTIAVVLFSSLTFPSFKLFEVSFGPILLPSWRNSRIALAAIGDGSGDGDGDSATCGVVPIIPSGAAQDAVVLPDQILVLVTSFPTRPTSSNASTTTTMATASTERTHLRRARHGAQHRGCPLPTAAGYWPPHQSVRPAAPPAGPIQEKLALACVQACHRWSAR